jgi:hypothetical protein
MVHQNEDKTYTLEERQGEAVGKMLHLFQRLLWQLKFNAYKELKFDDQTKAIQFGGMHGVPGTPVRTRPCGEKYANKTYFGILIGDVALSVSHAVKEGMVTAKFSYHNPAVIIPELGEIIYGCECWWSEIKTPADAQKLITDETIKNVWYMKMLADGGVANTPAQ